MRVDFTAADDDSGRRLESVIRRLLPRLPLASVHKAIRQGDVRVNGRKAQNDTKVAAGDVLSVWDKLLPSAEETGPPGPSRDQGQSVPDEWILFRSKDFLVVNKPSGLLVQADSTGDLPLDDMVRNFLRESQPASLSFRPGPLHRLDRPTSGLVVFSASLNGARRFSQALSQGEVQKTYWALLQGELTRQTSVDAALERGDDLVTHVSDQGKSARSVFVPLVVRSGVTLARVAIDSGRTHQIRAHAAQMGFPLAGDSKYGARPWAADSPLPWFLHARHLSCALFPPLTAPVDPATHRLLAKMFKVNLPATDL